MEQVESIEGLDLNLDAMSSWVDELCPYFNEITAIWDFHWTNGSFMAGDAHVLYGLIRKLRPSRVVEVGCGVSTRLMYHALNHNVNEVTHIGIDPSPINPPASIIDTLCAFRQQEVQQVELDVFDRLGPGDILFVDSSHIHGPGTDVEFILSTVLPRLKPGVYLHFHDVVWPHSYQDHYNHEIWNEQYVLQKLLTDNPTFKILWVGYWYMYKRYDHALKLFSEFTQSWNSYPRCRPSSLWMIKQ